MALISCIVPVFNVEPYLYRCVDSILAQTFTDFELILVDDGSPDNCGAICDQYAKEDSRIHVIHQKNGGLSAARNSGIDWVFAYSNSKYLNFIDSDDWVHPRYLELLYKAMKEYDVDISQCMFKRTSSEVDDHVINERMYCVTPEEQYSKWYSPFAWGKLYKRDCFAELRYPVGLLFEDIAIWYKLLFTLNRIAIVEDELYFYFQNEEGITNSAWKPAKLAQVKAWNEQIEFANKLDNKNVLHTALKRGCWVYKNQCEEISSSDLISDEEKAKYRKIIIRKLQAVLRSNKKELKEIGLYQTYFDYVHPKLNWLKWTAKGIAGKFR